MGARTSQSPAGIVSHGREAAHGIAWRRLRWLTWILSAGAFLHPFVADLASRLEGVMMALWGRRRCEKPRRWEAAGAIEALVQLEQGEGGVRAGHRQPVQPREETGHGKLHCAAA